LPGVGDALVLDSKHSRLQSPKPITDARIAALVRSHPPGGSIVFVPAHAENPRRRVTVVFSSTDINSPFSGNLVQLESDLAEAGIVYAVVEEDEQRAFARDLGNAMAAARNV
jgi:hypothetical protein